MEERFCQMVKELGCTCVTISHRPALMAFHDIVLALDGEGGWSLHKGARGISSEEGVAAGGLISILYHTAVPNLGMWTVDLTFFQDAGPGHSYYGRCTVKGC
jgi:hypothetical protein